MNNHRFDKCKINSQSCQSCKNKRKMRHSVSDLLITDRKWNQSVSLSSVFGRRAVKPSISSQSSLFLIPPLPSYQPELTHHDSLHKNICFQTGTSVSVNVVCGPLLQTRPHRTFMHVFLCLNQTKSHFIFLKA